MPYYVYILTCKGGSFYTGYTGNLNRRMRQHMNGKGARYTKMHMPRKVAYTEEFALRAQAMRRERSIKRLSHRQKQQLIKHQKKQK